MIKKIDHLVITTSSPEACLDFYKKLGFKVCDPVNRYELFAGDFKINIHIKDHELKPHAENVQMGSADLCFEISDNLEEFRSRLEKNGLEIILGIVGRNGVNGEMRSIYLRDPDGNLVEFCSYE